MGEHLVARARHIAGKHQRIAGRGFDELRKHLLALAQRLFSQIFAIEVQQVEHKIGKATLPRLERHLQRAEIRMAVRVGDRDLAVDQCAVARQCRQRFNERRKLVRPVEAAARANDDVAAADGSERAIAVELDLVQPFCAGGRFVHQRC